MAHDSHVDDQRFPRPVGVAIDHRFLRAEPLDPDIELAIRDRGSQLISDLDSFGKNRGRD